MLQGTDVPRGYNVQKIVYTRIPFSCKGGENVGNFHHALSFDDRLAILAKKKMAVSRKISTKTVTLYTLILVFIFSTLISPHFLWY